jgi:hypothetical protein
MDTKSIRVAKKLVSRLSKDYNIQKSILFGSRARGDNFNSSDYDLILVSDDFKGVFFPKRMAEVYKYWDEDVDLEPLCYTLEEFDTKKAQMGIVRRAIKEGIILDSPAPNYA